MIILRISWLNKFKYRPSGSIHGPFGFLSVVMRGGGITEVFCQIGKHGLDYRGMYGRGPVVVKVDAFICRHYLW